MTSTTNYEWLSLDEHRETAFLEAGKIILVKPKDKSVIVPLFCPLCEFPMRTSEDSMTFRDSGVCHHCDLKWIRPFDLKHWTPQSRHLSEYMPVQWEKYIEQRKLLSKPTMSFR